MDTSEATKVVLSRIKNLDPENASKIMGYILIQDQSDKEMIRLAFGPETFLLSHINQAKLSFALSPSSPFQNQNPFSSPPPPSSSSSSSYPNNNHSNTMLPFEQAGYCNNIDSGFLLRPCVYFARGFCKNGTTCNFLHMGNHPYNTLDFLNQNLRHECYPIGLEAGVSSSSRQIYLTFPADSTFKEEDVSNYFSTYGPVQEVRIPYQQKRMFGFVTFVYAETVKIILTKGNPHFVCDSRVLVKPYKEKGKVPDKKQQHFDSKEHVDLPIDNLHEGSKMFYTPQEMMLRQKLAEAELKHAIELQRKRMATNLQLVDLKIQHCNHRFPPRLRVPISSPRQSRLPLNQNAINFFNQEVFSEDLDAKSPIDQNSVLEDVNGGQYNLPESLEHILPDNLFASPTKSAAERYSAFLAGDSKPVRS